MSALKDRLVFGAIEGLAATLVMSGAFLLAQRAGLIDELPPRLIMERFLPRASLRTKRALATAAHLAYGTGAGAARAVIPLPRRTGIAYAVLVWAASYEGWVPAAGVLPPAHRDVRSRAGTILVAHLVFGAALAAARGIGARVGPNSRSPRG